MSTIILGTHVKLMLGLVNMKATISYTSNVIDLNDAVTTEDGTP